MIWRSIPDGRRDKPVDRTMRDGFRILTGGGGIDNKIVFGDSPPPGPHLEKCYGGQGHIFLYEKKNLRLFLCISNAFLVYFGNYIA